MLEVEINDVKKYIEAAPLEMNLMFIGDTGIGKTQVIREFAKDNGYHLEVLVLSQLRADEALGIPVRSKREFRGKEIDVLTTAVPEWVLRLAESEKPMLFLDEFLTAKPDVMNSFLSFLTEREVSGIDLSHVKIVTATNIGIYTFEPDTNIISRFCKFYVVNKTYNKHIGDKRVINDYSDETNKNHSIFDEFQLRPRNQYLLSLVEDNDLVYDFYEGFTNKSMGRLFSPNRDFNKFLNGLYSEQGSGRDGLIITRSNFGILVQFIKRRYPRLKNSKTIISKLNGVYYKNIESDSQGRISEDNVCEMIDKRLQ